MVLSLFLVVTAPEEVKAPAESPIEYGEAYVVEEAPREAPFFYISSGYAYGFSNSFMDLHSMTANTQVRLWKYISTGILGQWVFPSLNATGKEIRTLEKVDIHTPFPHPQWGLFSLTSIQIMLGRWNVMNLLPLDVDLFFGGGVGALGKRNDTNKKINTVFSYAWSVEQRLHFFKNSGLSFALLGHRGGVFLQAGFGYPFF